MTAKHTPGPWTVESCGCVKGIALHNSLNPRMQEDARLIAAAPDLLAVAEDALRSAQAMGWTEKMTLWGAVIEKAKGGAR